MMKLSASTLRTCLIALDAAYDREESVTAKLRISNASREISEILAAGPDVPQSTVSEDWDHLPTPAGTGSFTMKDLFGPNLIPEQWCIECGAVVIHEQARQIHVVWHNKVADL